MCAPSAPKPTVQEQRPLRYLLSRAQAREMGQNLGGNNPNAYRAPIMDPNYDFGRGSSGTNAASGGLGA